MKKQLVLAWGLALTLLTMGSGCLVISGGHGSGNGSQECLTDTYCEEYCDPWGCWTECWDDVTCDTVCTEVVEDVVPTPAPGDACVCDLDCAQGQSCISGFCVGEQNASNGKAGLCQTCEDATDCFEDNARCVRLNFDTTSRQGEKICSRVCDDTFDCPTGFECGNISQEAGVPAQCLPVGRDASNDRTCNTAADLECV